MKVLIVLCSLFVIINASVNSYEHGHKGYTAYESHAPITAKVTNTNTGHSTQSRKQDSTGNYYFSYEEQHHDGGSSRHETGDAHGNKHGTYSLNIGDGRQRFVKYVADDYGFRASIKTNEPGIVSQSPASITIITPQGKSYDGYEAYPLHAVPAYVSSVNVPISAPSYAYGPVEKYSNGHGNGNYAGHFTYANHNSYNKYGGYSAQANGYNGYARNY